MLYNIVQLIHYVTSFPSVNETVIYDKEDVIKGLSL